MLCCVICFSVIKTCVDWTWCVCVEITDLLTRTPHFIFSEILKTNKRNLNFANLLSYQQQKNHLQMEKLKQWTNESAKIGKERGHHENKANDDHKNVTEAMMPFSFDHAMSGCLNFYLGTRPRLRGKAVSGRRFKFSRSAWLERLEQSFRRTVALFMSSRLFMSEEESSCPSRGLEAQRELSSPPSTSS